MADSAAAPKSLSALLRFVLVEFWEANTPKRCTCDTPHCRKERLIPLLLTARSDWTLVDYAAWVGYMAAPLSMIAFIIFLYKYQNSLIAEYEKEQADKAAAEANAKEEKTK